MNAKLTETNIETVSVTEVIDAPGGQLQADLAALDSDLLAFKSSGIINASAFLKEGEAYSRNELKERLSTNDATINTGIFRPAGFSSILLFITQNKTKDRTPYDGHLGEKFLGWQGQLKGRKDSLIISHKEQGNELLVFYREKKNQYPGHGFRYEGRFKYVSHSGQEPTNFLLESLSEKATSLQANTLDLSSWAPEDFDPLDLEDARKRTLGAITRRQGQPIFRKKLLLAYGSRCAISECRVTETLEAAHIIGYRGEKTNHISNGLLLRTDLHTLFDLGMIAINDDYRVSIVPSLVGTEYDQWNGKRILLPSNPSDRPSLAALRIHRIAAGL